MKMSSLTRDPGKVLSVLKKAGNTTIATAPVKICVPARWRDKELVTIGNEVYTLGIFMMIVEDKYYSVNIVDAMVRINPTSINHVYLDDVDYLEFSFDKGETVFANMDLVKNDTLLYYIFDEFVSKGRVPAFMDYHDLGKLFDTAKKYAGVKLASTPTILHMVLSMIARSPDDPNIFFRQITNGKDFENVAFIPLKSTTHGANNTTARLLGAHFGDNLTSALVNPSDREESIERILRM